MLLRATPYQQLAASLSFQANTLRMLLLPLHAPMCRCRCHFSDPYLQLVTSTAYIASVPATFVAFWLCGWVSRLPMPDRCGTCGVCGRCSCCCCCNEVTSPRDNKKSQPAYLLAATAAAAPSPTAMQRGRILVVFLAACAYEIAAGLQAGAQASLHMCGG